MRLGVTLPQFRDDAEPALAVARRAEAAGLDGVFVFDHLWPLHQPDRPALHSLTLLGALVAETRRITLATFVARVSLLPDAVLVHTLFGLHRMCEGRFIAGLGTGDRENRDENIAYGVGFDPAEARARQLVDCCRRLRQLDVPTWVGGASPTARGIAAREADGWNGWGLSAEEFASQAAEVRAESKGRAEVTWGGQVHGRVDDLRRHLSALKEAGASWAVCSPLDIGTDDEAIDLLAEARPN